MVETRSQRQAYLQRPPYPSVSTENAPSNTQSVFQSSSSSLSSISSISSPGGAPQPPALRFNGMQAPMPSPSNMQPQPQPASYFGSLSSQSSQGYPAQQRIPDQAPQYAGQRGGEAGGAPETAPFLKDFSLVAEAAKRAQMACLERDLGECGL